MKTVNKDASISNNILVEPEAHNPGEYSKSDKIRMK